MQFVVAFLAVVSSDSDDVRTGRNLRDSVHVRCKEHKHRSLNPLEKSDVFGLKSKLGKSRHLLDRAEAKSTKNRSQKTAAAVEKEKKSHNLSNSQL